MTFPDVTRTYLVFLGGRSMEKILMSECPWCGNVYIKERVDSPHGCPEEREPAAHVVEAIEAVSEHFTIQIKR